MSIIAGKGDCIVGTKSQRHSSHLVAEEAISDTTGTPVQTSTVSPRADGYAGACDVAPFFATASQTTVSVHGPGGCRV